MWIWSSRLVVRRAGVVVMLIALAQSARARAATGSFTIEQPIDARTMLVWTMVGTPGGWERWFCDRARFPQKAGAVYEFQFREFPEPWRGMIFEYLPGHSIGLTWAPPAHGDSPAARAVTRVRLEVASRGNSAIVRLSHWGFTSTDELLLDRRAWIWSLHNLRKVLEEGKDLRKGEK